MWSTIVLSIVLLIVMCMLHSLGIYTMVITYVCINIAWLLVWHYFVWKEIRLGLFAALNDILPLQRHTARKASSFSVYRRISHGYNLLCDLLYWKYLSSFCREDCHCRKPLYIYYVDKSLCNV